MTVPQISHIGIVGAGTMGARIAYRCVVKGFETAIYDKFPDALEKAVNRIIGWFDENVKSGKLMSEEAVLARTRLSFSTDLEECVKDKDLVIETVPENLKLKRQVFTEIDKFTPKEALIATNSSSIPCSRIADVTLRPEKVFNINFSDPTYDLEVEIMKGAQTGNGTLIAAEKFCRSLGMVPIVTMKEIMGFSFNRIWRAIKREALHQVDGDYSNHEDIDRAWMLHFGTSIGPFGFMDKVGLDVVRDIEMQYFLESGDERDRPPQFLEDMIAHGQLGHKSGRGFYSYPNPDYENPAWLHKEKPFDENLQVKLALP
jgi:3-hydroxybutyryl-CoA dehydrogenase